MQEILRLAAEPCQMHDNAKSLIARAAGVLHLSYRRAFTLWYGEEGRRVRADEAARLRAEKDRLLICRLKRLRAEIAETERLLGVQSIVLAQAVEAAARDTVQPHRPTVHQDRQLVLPLNCGAA
jgi:hypothetical protein